MKRNFGKILAALFALTVLLSFSMITILADEAPDAVGAEAPTDDGAAAPDGTADDVAAADDLSEENADDASTKAADDAAKTVDDAKTEQKKFLLRTGLITLAIIVVILICVLVWVLKDRERALKTWRSFKSEFKKVVWADKHQTTKNTILVIVAIVLFAAVIGVVDYLLSIGIIGLGKVI